MQFRMPSPQWIYMAVFIGFPIATWSVMGDDMTRIRELKWRNELKKQQQKQRMREAEEARMRGDVAVHGHEGGIENGRSCG